MKHLFNLKEKVYLKLSFEKLSSSLNTDINLKKSYRDRVRIKSKDMIQNQFHSKNFIPWLIEEYIYFNLDALQKDNDFNDLKNTIEKIQFNEKEPKCYFLKVLKIILNDIGDERNLDLSIYYDTFVKFIELLEKIPKNRYYEKQVLIPIGIKEQPTLRNLLKFIDGQNLGEENFLNSIVLVEIEPMSAGEEAFINLFASLNFGIREIPGRKDTALILLDEPDNFMHPEWSRLMLSEIINLLNQFRQGYKNYQIIITTHSPFICSDLPKECVIRLNKCAESGNCMVTPISEINQTFASNIYDLFSSSFFMSATIGEYAKTKIEAVINSLTQNEILKEEDKKHIQDVISVIGEPLLRNKLIEMYNNKDPEYKKKVLEKRLKEIQSQLAGLNADDTN